MNYQVVNEDITLCDSGELGESNKALLIDNSWDRKYQYGPCSSDYVPTLYSLFAGFRNVISTDSSEDESGSISLEGD